jgi:hypothetical protein
MKIFLSVGATYNDEQEAFVSGFEVFLLQNNCVRLTVGRDNERSDQPIFAARELMQTADAVIVLAFTRFVVKSAIEKPGSTEQKTIKDRNYPTVWNQLEAAMGFGLNLPMLVILEDGLYAEAMLKDRLEFRVITTQLDTALFSSEKFKSQFKDWMERANKKNNQPIKNLSEATIGQLIRGLRPDQLWKIGSAVVGFVASISAFAFWLGKTL